MARLEMWRSRTEVRVLESCGDRCFGRREPDGAMIPGPVWAGRGIGTGHHMKKLIALGMAGLFVASMSVRAEDAKAIYEKDCAKCHGADGKGDTKMGKRLGCKDYTDASVQAELKDDAAIKAIKEGLKKDDKTLMKPAEGLSDEDIKGLVAYMRTFKK